MSEPYFDGKEAYSSGLKLYDNPYQEVERELAQLWESGWNDAFREEAQTGTLYFDGKNSYSNGKELDDNPYKDADSDHALHWELGWKDAFEARQNFVNPTPSKETIFLMKLKRSWGMIFRLLFIGSIGFVGYLWIDPQSIGDIPFLQLTLNHVFKNIFAGLLVLGCVVWFFCFPKRHKETNDEDDPYIMWTNFSGILIFIGILIWFWFNK